MRGHGGVQGLLKDSRLWVGLFAGVLGAAFSWRPSYWYDEGATVFGAQRPLPDLLRFLDHQDAVHGLYYLAMHFWFRLVGESEFTSRLPSALAIGVAAAGVVTLGQLVADRRTALLAGVVFAILPRVTWAAVEARSYACTAAAAVWLTVVLVVALRRRRRQWWVLYALGCAVSIVLFIDMATLVLAHAVVVVVLNRKALPAWGTAAVAGGLLALPAARVISRQSGQVAWIPAPDRYLIRALLEYQWFVGAPVFAVLALALLVVALLRVRDQLIAVALPWALVPTVLLVGYSFIEPVYLDRYLTFTTPAVALLVGAGIGALAPTRWTALVLLGALAAAAVPAYVAQRGEWAKPSGMDFSAVAAFMADHHRPGDCVLFANKSAWNPTSARVARNIRPSAFEGMRDVGAGRSAVVEGWLWDENLPLSAVNLGDCTVLWYIGDADRDSARTIRHTSNEVWPLGRYHFDTSPDHELLVERGFVVDQRWELHTSQIVRLTAARR